MLEFSAFSFELLFSLSLSLPSPSLSSHQLENGKWHRPTEEEDINNGSNEDFRSNYTYQACRGPQYRDDVRSSRQQDQRTTTIGRRAPYLIVQQTCLSLAPRRKVQTDLIWAPIRRSADSEKYKWMDRCSGVFKLAGPTWNHSLKRRPPESPSAAFRPPVPISPSFYFLLSSFPVSTYSYILLFLHIYSTQ